jgi:hypothetical protein
MKTTNQPNFIKSSNLLFITGVLIIISSIITRFFIPTEANNLPIIIINLIFIGSVGLIIRQGINWTKYLSLTLLILYLIEASFFIISPEVNFILKTICVMQIILLAFATIVLFVKTQKKDIKIA